MKYKLPLSFILLLLLSSIGFAQIPHEVKLIHFSMDSKFLADSRELMIALPADYSQDKKYPVSYVLDGESLFHGHSDVVRYLSEKNVIPQMIVVGIPNQNRSFDLTHVSDSASNFQPNGGGANFESFLKEELIPYVDSNYSTAPYRVLTGHSISGLFAGKLLLNDVHTFNAYILLDPALWWSKMEILNSAAVNLSQAKEEQKKTYLAIANNMPSTHTNLEEALKDTSNSTLGIRSIFKLQEGLEKTGPSGEFWNSQYYEKERHSTLPFIGTYDGFKFIFDFYPRPSLQSLSDDSPAILEEHYKMLSDKMGYLIAPPAYDLSGLAWRCQDLDMNHNRAYAFLQLYLKYYPQDPIAHVQMAQHFQIIGEEEKAMEYYQQALALGYEPDEN